MAKSLYIHIPFCNQICSYCDFPKVFFSGQDTDAYLTALIAELSEYEKIVGFSELQTIYIGGGTPTVLTIKQLDKLFTYLHSVIDFNHLTEISIEANPESLNDTRKVICLKNHGVTRVSLGVQTFNDHHLGILERSHCKKDVYHVVHLLDAQGFEINLDMIYAIPTQTLTDWARDLDTLLQLPITHVSAYSLILEAHTNFYIDYMNDQLELVDNEVEAKMFELVIEKLTKAGFVHYEISNFTRGKRSSHNMTYWKNDDYIGVGLGAHGKIKTSAGVAFDMDVAAGNITQEIVAGNDRIRYENTRSITAYKKALAAEALPVLNAHALTLDAQIEESMFLGLRVMDGIDVNEVSARYHQDVLKLYNKRIDQLRKMDYVRLEGGVLRLTKKGLMMANDVFEAFLL